MLTVSSTKKVWLLTPDIGEDERRFVNEAFDSNWVAPLGPNVNLFEEELSNHFHNSNVHIVNSGTSAIHLALKSLNVKEGDIVLCQSFTFAGSAFPILYEKAVPVFIDSEKDTWNLDPNLLEDAILYYQKKNIKPAAIIVVHLYGMPAKMNEIISISKKYEIPIIEDAAEAMGSEYENKNCGTLTDIGIVSFNGNKIITTSGGGAIISNNIDHISKARYLSNCAKDNIHYYSHSDVGFNYRMSNVLAGIGRGQLMSLQKKVEKKRFIYNTYEAFLNQIEGVAFLQEPLNAYSNRWLSNIVLSAELREKVSLEDLRTKLSSHNIETRFLWNPMHLQPIFKDAVFFGSSISEELFKSGICLPSTTTMTIDDIIRVANLLKETLYA
jgi:dTDP-4-amino-4,6-dideoxygalactose transaminase